MKRLRYEYLSLFTATFDVLLHTVFLVELVNTSASLSCFLLSGVERMALGADLHVDVLIRRTGHECVTAVACYGSLKIFRMNPFAHVIFHLT